jgi:hypothetical protein
MAEKKIVATASSSLRDAAGNKQKAKLPLFEKDNYMWMGIGAIVIAIGMLVMSGGRMTTPTSLTINWFTVLPE